MSLPKLTAFIGAKSPLNNKGEFVSLIEDVKKVKEDEEPYIVFLVLNILKDEIYFKFDKKLTRDSVYDCYYFGNNAGAGLQYYLTRETNSLKYLIGSTLSDLFLQLTKNGMENNELGDILKNLQQKNILTLGEKKGEGKLNFKKFSLVKNGTVDKIKLGQKGVIVDEKKYNPEAFIRLFIGDENKKNKFVLIIPKLINEIGEEIILSTNKDYLELVKIENNLGSIKKEKKQKAQRVCHVCRQKKSDASSKYSKYFSRKGINKIFTTTTINTTQFLQNYNYDNNYAICGDCYQKLLIGEKVVLKQFKSRIAGEDAFIIPEGMLQDFDYNFLNTLKNNVDLAFRGNDAKTWLTTIETEKEENKVKYYAINFIIYRTDGNSVTVLETIEDVPTVRFEKIMKLFVKYTETLNFLVNNISISSVYRLIPVKVDKYGTQLDIGRVLSFYKAILSGENINSNVIFDYAVESLEKGLKQLAKARIDNYYNMGLARFKGYEDFFIKRIVYGYVVLLKTCQELGVLNSKVFNELGKEGKKMMDFKTNSQRVNSIIMQVETFLEDQGFNNEAKALFYLGILINKVALYQVAKEHKKKPILKKIQFQGMNQKEIYNLYNDVVEKLIQYEQMGLFNQACMRRFHDYFGSLDSEWTWDDKANVFYIMAGYAYLVGRKTEDFSGEEGETEETLV
jgi:CRISPR-associated protein Csh1